MSRQKQTARRWSRTERRENRAWLQRHYRNGERTSIPTLVRELYRSRRDARKFLLFT